MPTYYQKPVDRAFATLRSNEHRLKDSANSEADIIAREWRFPDEIVLSYDQLKASRPSSIIVWIDHALAKSSAVLYELDDPVIAILPWVFNLGILGFLPVGIFLSWWIGLATLFAAIISVPVTNWYLTRRIRSAGLRDEQTYLRFLEIGALSLRAA